jgi:(E)-4-hydroxy-3-methylbut-2-enyl-diphosphate synthase
MKASNPLVMVEAYRLLVIKMNEEGMNYPLHLGVTEAGEGEDGRIKSAVGIGTLLEDGLGDTIRVSLTEEPEFEVPVAKILAKRYSGGYDATELSIDYGIPPTNILPYSPLEYKKRVTDEILNIGGKQHPVVIADWSKSAFVLNIDALAVIGYRFNPLSNKWKNNDQAADYIFLGKNSIEFDLPENLKPIYNYEKWVSLNQNNSFPFFNNIDSFLSARKKSNSLNFVSLTIADIKESNIDKIKSDNTLVWVAVPMTECGMAEERRVFIELMAKSNRSPVIIHEYYGEIGEDELRLFAATDIGGLLIEGMGDGIWLRANVRPAVLNSIGFGILQATRTRISKTEYISCPSCGRTLFNLQEVTAKIHERTAHLKGVKIGIMGCVVNGPGEMADADYGYVGTGVGKITLFKGKEVVQRNIPSEQAVDALIALIKNNGDWVEESVDA